MAARERPCVNSTLWEVNRGKHLTTTRRKNGMCENCVTVLKILKNRRMAAERLDEELV